MGLRSQALRFSSYCAVVTLAWLAQEKNADACGAAYPGGPVMCDFPRGGESAARATRPLLRLSSSYAYTSTTLLFSGAGDRRADMRRHAAFVGMELPLSRSPTSSFALQLGAGGIGNGELVTNASATGPSRSYDVGPGFSGFVGLAGRVVDAGEWTPFVHLTGTFSVSHAATRSPSSRDSYTAFDLRIGAIVGKTIEGVFTPYVAARVFGGPVLWKIDGASVTGTDLYKYQLGGGVSFALFERRLDLFAEAIGLGERGVAAGIGTTFF